MTIRLPPRSKRPSAFVAGAAIAGTLAACGHSPPTQFFTLEPAPASPGASSARPLAPVQLDAVHIPPALDRLEMVTQPGPDQLSVSDLNHWGAPLGEMMRRTLAQDLQARLPRGAFVFPDAPQPAGVRALVVTVLQLTASPDGRVDIQANWSLLASGSANPVAGENVQVSGAGGAGPAGQAQAISQALGVLADRIAAALAQA